jgi:alkylation response protein AidB-like acyl-CoA dehydrogenase
MPQLIADRRDVDFVLHEQLMVGDLARRERFAEFNRKAVDLIVSEARNLAIKEILPTQKDGDRQGVHFEGGRVRVPESFHKAWKAFRGGDWLAMTEDPAWGGQGMPRTVALAALDYLSGANLAFMMYSGLTHGAGRLLERFGTEKQKNLFLKKMYNGQWTGTMLLTESEAGSDVGALTTSAVKNPDGTYAITGNKIFISSGEHDLAENIIHPVLARIEGAPAGTGGISLFLVPKIWVNDDGSLGEPNDILCTGIEEKMGIHGNATCSIALGSQGRCRGMLLGEKNKGMRAMFLMMNDARLLVGTQGLACASPAYLYAVNYARERIQGRHLLLALDKSAPSVPIIQHPDVRRMLMTMKVYVEGMRSLLYYVGHLEDCRLTAAEAGAQDRYQGLIDLLIPITKGYVTERACEVCNLGIQIYGGYGYIREYPMEQLLRDCRITTIYEGTNGIQAMDLLGRKLGLNQGRPMMDLLAEIQATIDAAKAIPRTALFTESVEQAVKQLGEVAVHLGALALSDKVLTAFALAHPFLEVCGDVVMAWMLLWRARVAAEKLDAGAKGKDAFYYEGQLKSIEYFASTILPVAFGKMKAILAGNSAVVDISEESFGGK